MDPNSFYSPYSPRHVSGDLQPSPPSPSFLPESSSEPSAAYLGPADELAQQLGVCHLSDPSTMSAVSFENNPSYMTNNIFRVQDPRVQDLVSTNPLAMNSQSGNGSLWGSPYGVNVNPSAGYHGDIWRQEAANPNLEGYAGSYCIPFGTNEVFGRRGDRRCYGGSYYTPASTSPVVGRGDRRSYGHDDGTANSNLLQAFMHNGGLFGLMTNKHGNYSFQKFLVDSDEQQKSEIVWMVVQDPRALVRAATNPYGMKCVRKLITEIKMSPWLCSCFTSALSDGIVDLMLHSNGHSMVGILLEELSADHTKFIFEAALENFNVLSRHQKGILSLQHCIKKSRAPYRRYLINKVIENSFELAADMYGNYIVQSVLDFKDAEITKQICLVLKEHIEVLSVSKSASYVIEKCLKSSSGVLIHQALRACRPQTLEEISSHPYGNYVMQSAIMVGKGMPHNDELIKAVRGLSGDLEYHVNARNVLNLVSDD